MPYCNHTTVPLLLCSHQLNMQDPFCLRLGQSKSVILPYQTPVHDRQLSNTKRAGLSTRKKQYNSFKSLWDFQIPMFCNCAISIPYFEFLLNLGPKTFCLYRIPNSTSGFSKELSILLILSIWACVFCYMFNLASK